MQNLIWKIILIALILISCAFAVTPPEKKIRLGRDLSGGVSLVYSVRMDDDTPDPGDTFDNAAEINNAFVVPQAIFDLLDSFN